jgi:hypothetical protein
MGFWGFYSGAKESFSSDGKPNFTLGNGQQGAINGHYVVEV